MKDLKHTKEYAKKLAKENCAYEEDRALYIEGYMKAIEETEVSELLEALLLSKNIINSYCKNISNDGSVIGRNIAKIDDLIKKITE